MANRIKLAGTTANIFDIGISRLSLSASQVSTPYTLTFPGNVGSANTFLKNDGTGNLSWSAAGSGNSIENGTSNVKINSSGSPVAISVNGTSNVAVFNQSSANITGSLSVSGNTSTANLSAITQITRNSRNVPVFVYQSNTAPTTPLVGDQWYDTNTGTLFEYLNDGTTAAWIDMNGNPGSLVNLTVNGTASFSNISVSGTVTAGAVAGNLVPSLDNTYFLGNATNRWANLWLGPGTIYITDSANTANTAQLTVFNGILQVNGATGLQANLISGNSTLTLANSGNITLNAGGSVPELIVSPTGTTITGNLEVSGNIVGNIVTANISGNAYVGNLISAANISAAGNVTATYFKGDGSLLTGIAPTVQVYEFANIASGVSTYLTAQWLANYTAGAKANITATVGTTGTLITSFITQSGYPNITVLPVGTIAVTYESKKASGNKAYYTYAELYRRTTGGTETLLATTDLSNGYTLNTTEQNTLPAYIAAPVAFAATDRVVVKIYAYTSQGTDSITISFDENTNSGLQLPALPASAAQFVPYNNPTANLAMGVYNITANGLNSTSTISATGNITAGNLNSIGTYSTVIGGTNRDVYVDNTGLLGYVSSIKASKANIEPLTDTNWLLQLNAVSFNRRKKDAKGKYTEKTYKELEYGLIAEEVEAVNDVLCFYDKEKNNKTGKSSDKLAGVHYGKLVVPLLKLVQEQQAMIKDLSNRLTEIENKNSDKNKSE